MLSAFWCGETLCRGQACFKALFSSFSFVVDAKKNSLVVSDVYSSSNFVW